MIVLYQSKRSRSDAARWLLEELGLDYGVVDVDIDAGAHRTPTYLGVNPMGKVPAILDGEVPVSEMAAITIYLCDRYTEKVSLAPGIDDPQRGAYLRWIVFASGALEPALMQKHLGFETVRSMTSWGDYELVSEVLNGAVSDGPFLLGDRFTGADVALGAGINFGLNFGLLEVTPALSAYRERLASRAAFQRAFA